jgi:cathepsin L
LALNRFADVTNKEFRATRAGFKKPQQKLLAAKAEEPKQLLTCANVDNEINWKERGHVTPVRNQGQCGSCWAFSTTAAMESHYHIHGRGDLEWISPQQLIDCTGDLGEMGCNGGNFDAAFQYGSMHMIQKDVDYPYKAEKGAQCLHDASKDATGVHITSWRDIQKNSPSQILCALQNGPVSVAINAGLAVQFYFGGVVRHLCGDSIDHAVTLVGRKCGKQPWWEHSPFKHAGDECYWIIKNSWGADYGDKGYTYILDEQKEGSTGMCGVNMMAAQPTI